MTQPLDQAKSALDLASAGQPLVDAWHRRMADLDLRAPKQLKPKDDSKRGCESPLGGKVW